MCSRMVLVLLSVIIGSGPGTVLAAADPSHGGGESGHVESAEAALHEKPPLLSFDPGAAIWSIIVFVVLLLVMRAFFWKPILQMLQQREKFIRDSLDQAKKDREEAGRALQAHAAQLHQARAEAEAIVAEGRRDAEVVHLKIKEDAQNEADAILERAKRDIELARATAIKDIYEVGAQLAVNAAARILGREVDAQEHERLIAESIEELAGRRN